MRHRLAYLLDTLLASDPALDRARSSLRALFTAASCAGAFLLLTRALGLDYKLALPGIVVPMMAGVALQDPGRRQQQVTMAWVPVVASAALIASSLVADNFVLGGGVFLLTIFAAFQVRRFGPRGAGLGTIAYQSVFYGMLFKTPPDKAQWLPLFVAAGCAIAWAMHFWIVPQHPGRMVHDELRAFHARVRVLLADLAHLLHRPGDAAKKRIAPQLARLNAQSLALDQRLAGFAAPGRQDAGLRDAVLRCELAVDTIAAVAQASSGDGHADRGALAQRLLALRKGVPAAPGDIPGMEDTLRWRLDRAARTLARCAPWRQSAPAMRDEKGPPAQQDKPAKDSPLDDANGRRRFDDTTRRASQATVAALGALAAGYALSPTHWYWAVFAALVVFTRSVTVGQTVSGAWRQLLAAAGGVCFGMLVAELAHGHRTLELGLLFAFVAIGFYAYKGLQNLYVIVLTAMLAMVYELLGQDSAGLLLLRLGETAVGAACAVLSARFVLPVSTHDESDGKSAALLRTAARLLKATLDPRRPGHLDAVRELDRGLQALRQSVGPVAGRGNPASSGRSRDQLAHLSGIAGAMRHLFCLITDRNAAIARIDSVRRAVDAIAPNLEKVAAMLEEPDRDGRKQPVLAALPAPGNDGAPASRVADGWLAQVDEALRALGALR